MGTGGGGCGGGTLGARTIPFFPLVLFWQGGGGFAGAGGLLVRAPGWDGGLMAGADVGTGVGTGVYTGTEETAGVKGLGCGPKGTLGMLGAA